MVTGATSGIGRAVARELVQSGATVMLHGRNEKALEALYQELKPLGPGAVGRADRPRASPRAAVPAAHGRDRDPLRPARRPAAQRRDPRRPQPDRALRHRALAARVARQPDRAVHPHAVPVAAAAQLADASVVFTTSSVGRRGRAYWGAYSVAKVRDRRPRAGARPTSSRTRRFASTSSIRAARARGCARALIRPKTRRPCRRPRASCRRTCICSEARAAAIRGQRFDSETRTPCSVNACALVGRRAQLRRRAPCGARRRGRRSLRDRRRSR